MVNIYLTIGLSTHNGGDTTQNRLLRVKIVRLVDRSDLFKISNLVYDGRETVVSLYSSLQGQRVLWCVW